MALLALLVACGPPGANQGPPEGEGIEHVPGDGPVPTTPGDPDVVYDRTVVHAIELTATEAAIDSLRYDPGGWVEADLRFDGVAYDDVAVHVKGSASFQPVDEKPSWKIELDQYVPGQRVHGLERLTLNNEVWDPTMMAETMAYLTFRSTGAPAPRTGYTQVRLNGRVLGLYAIIETMDDAFVEANWPGSDGGLWESTVDCDFTSDPSCFPLQESGSSYDPTAIARACQAAASGDPIAIDAAFDWSRIRKFLAAERAVNHPDSYSWNLNNYFVYHDPLTDLVSLTPWGADSTFVYAYPIDSPNPTCDPIYLDVDTTFPVGWLTRYCAGDDPCRRELGEELLVVADWMESADLVETMRATAALLDPYVAEETWVNWTPEDREARVACFLDWTARRPDELRAAVGATRRD